jgi:hypothetical protein
MWLEAEPQGGRQIGMPRVEGETGIATKLVTIINLNGM